MQRIVLLVSLSWIGLAIAAEPAAEAPIHLAPGAVTTPRLVARLAERDRALFDAVFGCDSAALRPMVADDFEFLHDEYGKIADSGPKSVANVAAGCMHQKAGTDFRSRRELVPIASTAGPACSPRPAGSWTCGSSMTARGGCRG